MESSTLKARLLDKPQKCKNLYVGSSIPQKKLYKAIKTYASDVKADEVIALFDDTVFGSATDGFLLTETYLVDSKHKKKVDLATISSVYCVNDMMMLGNAHSLKPALKSSIDLPWLAKQLHEHIHSVFIQDKSLKELFAETPISGAGFYDAENLPQALLDYLEAIGAESSDVTRLLPAVDIIAAIVGPLEDASSPDQEEIYFLTDKYLFFKNRGEEPHILPLSGILSAGLNSGGVEVKTLDGTSWSIRTAIEKKTFLPFFSVFMDYIDNYLARDPKADVHYFENLFHPVEEADSSGLIGGAAELVSNNPLFKVISLLNGKSVVIVAFLRTNAPDRVLRQLQNLPGVGLAVGVARVVLSRALNWLNNQIMKHGEAYMMKQLVTNFRKRGISKAQLVKEIDSSVYTILGDDIVEDSLELLNKYMPDEEES